MRSIEKERETKRKFGIVLAIVTAGFGIISMWRGRESLVTPLLVLAAVFLIVSLVAPLLLTPIYSVMLRLSMYMGWLNTRIILMVVYYLVFTPVALVFRLMGRDPLSRKFEAQAKTYWIRKQPREGDVATHYEKQF